jgi:hypothetical protein
LNPDKSGTPSEGISYAHDSPRIIKNTDVIFWGLKTAISRPDPNFYVTLFFMLFFTDPIFYSIPIFQVA